MIRTPEEELIAREDTAALDAALDKLADRHATIIRQRYGLDGEPMTFKAIGELHGVTTERVRQIVLKYEGKLFWLIREAYPSRFYASQRYQWYLDRLAREKAQKEEDARKRQEAERLREREVEEWKRARARGERVEHPSYRMPNTFGFFTFSIRN